MEPGLSVRVAGRLWSNPVKLFGFDLTLKRAPLSPVDNRGGWAPFIHEPYSGAWQRNDEWSVDSVLQYPTVFACVTQIAGDIGKLGAKLMRQQSSGIWTETTSAAFSPVLRKPNRFQTAIQFRGAWMISKLIHGNTYALKQRDNRGVVTALYVLDPCRVTPLVAPDGEVYYQLQTDNLSGITETDVTVPASEIVHDRFNCLFHPLIGVSPLFAAGQTAALGLKMESDSMSFYRNGAMPGGVLEAPGAISKETADRLRDQWSTNYTGANSGKTAVLGDGLKYNPVKMTAVDAQQVQRQHALDEYICAAFHVPPYMIGLGTLPSGMTTGQLKQHYYDTCLHALIEDFEAVVDEGLALPMDMRVELDLSALLRMDFATQVSTLGDAVLKSIFTPNEARAKFDMPPIEGGNTVYLQQQNYSLEALARRDAQPDPFGTAPAPTPAPEPDPEPADIEAEAEEQMRAFLAEIQKGLTHV